MNEGVRLKISNLWSGIYWLLKLYKCLDKKLRRVYIKKGNER